MSEQPTATEQKLASRSPFSRISCALGLTQKPRWIQDFRIELDRKDPQHRFSPGDVLRGTVFFTPTKALRITHITISLYGFARVYKTFNISGEGLARELLHADPNRLLGVPGVVPLFTPVEESLFGDVKLQPCRGQFKFAIRLPDHRLPSSISFERGAIQYNVISTITRPHSINPLIRCDPVNVPVYENIDCATIPKPAQKLVTLEAVEKKKKKRGKKAPSLTVNVDKFARIADREPSSPSSSLAPSTDDSHHGGETASVSNSSSSTELRIANIALNAGSNAVSLAGSVSSNGNSKFAGKTVATEKSIQASAEVAAGAFLPGDVIPVRVQVSHVKPVKSMCGLIVTLYRKTHIETEPLIHRKVEDADGNIVLKPVGPDVYPKSLTGLGGLSMSNKQTSHTFRMDVAQTYVPLFVDRLHHKADIKASLRIPTEGVHPTITGVRGDTLDFRYYLEVCLDIQGKLEETRLLPRLTNQAVFGLGKASTRKGPSVPMSVVSQGQQLIDTQTIRREKQIVSWQFHVVVGTRDSSRGMRSSTDLRPQSGDPWAADTRMQRQVSAQGSETSRGPRLDDVHEEPIFEGQQETIWQHQEQQDRVPYHHEQSRRHEYWPPKNRPYHESAPRDTLPPSAPPPLVMPYNAKDEKARLKQREETLLPSRPEFDQEPSASTFAPPPSAPPAHEVESYGNGGLHTSRVVQLQDSGYDDPATGNRPSLHRSQTHDGLRDMTSLGTGSSSTSAGPVTPRITRSDTFAGFDFSDSGVGWPVITEDKQELERRRLLEIRSAPDYGNADQPNGAQTAAALTTDDDHQTAFGNWHTGQEDLPKYE